MKNHVFVAVACLFLAACSGGGETKVAKLEAIPLGVAFENQTELKTSDCFKKIRYVALETTDSCLVGQGAYATILNDWIVVTSGRDRCQLFDKKRVALSVRSGMWGKILKAIRMSTEDGRTRIPAN